MRKDTSTEDNAHKISQLINEGEHIALDAAIAATKSMVSDLQNVKSKDARTVQLEHHAVLMGVGTQFMKSIAPKAQVMRDDLIKRGSTEGEARIHTGLWLAKVFKEIEKGVAKHEQ